LDDADVVAILDQDVVDVFPARTICPGAVNQNKYSERDALKFCADSAPQVNSNKTMQRD
jgi:hypothetical protein